MVWVNPVLATAHDRLDLVWTGSLLKKEPWELYRYKVRIHGPESRGLLCRECSRAPMRPPLAPQWLQSSKVMLDMSRKRQVERSK